MRTVRTYRDAVLLFLRFLGRHRKTHPSLLSVRDVEETGVLAFLGYLEQERGNSIQTRNQRLVAIRGLFNYIALQDPVLMEECRQISSIPLKRQSEIPEIGYLEKDEMKTILRLPDRGTSLGRRDHALLLFMYNTGARAQETTDALVSWLSLDAPARVTILGKGRKWRTCPLWHSVARTLRDLVAEQPAGQGAESPLFLNRYGDAMTRFGIWSIVRKYADRAAGVIPSLKKKRVTPHTIRHTTAMHLLQSGVEINVIRSWLGHVNLATTHRYVEIDLEMKRRALESCELAVKRTGKGRRLSEDVLSWLESL